MPATIEVIEGQTVISVGENTAVAVAAATEATLAANAASAAGNYFPSKALGEAATATGGFFSYPDGAGGLIYAERTAGGSTIIAEAATQAQIDTKVSSADLASTVIGQGGTLVGLNDDAGGSLWTNVYGFVAFLRSSVGSSVLGFIAAGTGAVLRSILGKLREVVSPDDFGAVGNGVADDTSAVNAALAAVGWPGKVHLPQGKIYRVTTITNTRGVGFSGPGLIISGTGNAKTVLRAPDRDRDYVLGLENRARLFARIGSTPADGTNLTCLIVSDSTGARGSTTVTGGISGTTLTVSNANGATLIPGTYVTAVSPTCRIVSQSSGTQFGAGTYVISESASIAGGSNIATGNGGGFAGFSGEPQNLMRDALIEQGIEKVAITNLGLGGETWPQMVTRNHAQYVNASLDAIFVKPPINGSEATLAADISAMRTYFADLRAATYGPVNLLTIFVLGYTPTLDTTGGRTSYYQEMMVEAIEQAAEDYDLVFLNTRAWLKDAAWMIAHGYLDAAGVHPLGSLQQQIWQRAAEQVFHPGEARLSMPSTPIILTPQTPYTAYDNGFGNARAIRHSNGFRRLRGGFTVPSPNNVTANDTFAYLPNRAYWPDCSTSFMAITISTGGARGLLWCTIGSDGRIFASESASGIAAIIIPTGVEWPGRTL